MTPTQADIPAHFGFFLQVHYIKLLRLTSVFSGVKIILKNLSYQKKKL